MKLSLMCVQTIESEKLWFPHMRWTDFLTSEQKSSLKHSGKYRQENTVNSQRHFYDTRYVSRYL